MGKSFICTQFFREINSNICFKDPCLETNEDQIIINLDDQKNQYENKIEKIENIEKKDISLLKTIKITELKNYFNENEKEIIKNYYKRDKSKKHLNKKKHVNALNRLSDNKYELMLKRLLEQKTEKRKGPKRRETIRNQEMIRILVNGIIIENTNKDSQNKEEIDNQENDLLIKNLDNQKYRLSATIDKNHFLSTNLSQNLKNNFKFQYLNTINEIINESSRCSGFCKKQTKQSNSPPNKKY